MTENLNYKAISKIISTLCRAVYYPMHRAIPGYCNIYVDIAHGSGFQTTLIQNFDPNIQRFDPNITETRDSVYLYNTFTCGIEFDKYL